MRGRLVFSDERIEQILHIIELKSEHVRPNISKVHDEYQYDLSGILQMEKLLPQTDKKCLDQKICGYLQVGLQSTTERWETEFL